MLRFLMLCFVLFFTACAKTSPEERQKLRLSLTSDPTMLDPRRARDLNSIALIHMLFEGLTRTSKMGETELALADNVEVSEDGLRYVFHLRKAQWSNGDPVTAFDFYKSWQTILDPNFGSDIAYQLYPIKNARQVKLGERTADEVGLKVLDQQTLMIELESPLPYFLELLSMTSFFPVPSSVANQNDDWAIDPAMFVSNGPFSLESWKHSDRLTLRKNAYYWEGEKVRLSSVDFLIASPDTALRMFEQGTLDWTGSPLSTIPSDAIQGLKQAELLQVSPFLATYFYRLNTSPLIKEKNNPLANLDFRRALSFALDRDAIACHVLQGGHKAAKSLVPPEMGLASEGCWIEQTTNVKYDLQEPIIISYSNTERNAAIAQIVQKQWEEKLGVVVQLEAVEPKIFFQRISQKEFQIAAGSWSADFNDPINFLEVFKYKDGGTNNTGWEHPDYIDLLNRSTLCKDKRERKELLQSAERLLMEQMPIIPIFHFALNYLKNAQLNNVSLSSMGLIDVSGAYFDSASTTGRIR